MLPIKKYGDTGHASVFVTYVARVIGCDIHCPHVPRIKHEKITQRVRDNVVPHDNSLIKFDNDQERMYTKDILRM